MARRQTAVALGRCLSRALVSRDARPVVRRDRVAVLVGGAPRQSVNAGLARAREIRSGNPFRRAKTDPAVESVIHRRLATGAFARSPNWLSVGAYVTPQLLGGSSGLMFGNIIASQFLSDNNWAFGSALAVTMMLVVTLVLSVLGRFVGLQQALLGSR